eukprot:2153904-Amphidinium_carterae.2
MALSIFTFVSLYAAVQSTSSGVFAPTTLSELQSVVEAWCSGDIAALEVYGHISDWNTSAITSMASLFEGGCPHNTIDKRALVLRPSFSM